jgi:hypothetical protein
MSWFVIIGDALTRKHAAEDTARQRAVGGRRQFSIGPEARLCRPPLAAARPHNTTRFDISTRCGWCFAHSRAPKNENCRPCGVSTTRLRRAAFLLPPRPYGARHRFGAGSARACRQDRSSQAVRKRRHRCALPAHSKKSRCLAERFRNVLPRDEHMISRRASRHSATRSHALAFTVEDASEESLAKG